MDPGCLGLLLFKFELHVWKRFRSYWTQCFQHHGQLHVHTHCVWVKGRINTRASSTYIHTAHWNTHTHTHKDRINTYLYSCIKHTVEIVIFSKLITFSRVLECDEIHLLKVILHLHLLALSWKPGAEVLFTTNTSLVCAMHYILNKIK